MGMRFIIIITNYNGLCKINYNRIVFFNIYENLLKSVKIGQFTLVMPNETNLIYD